MSKTLLLPGLELIAVYVKPEYRGKSVSKKLVQHLLAALENRPDVNQLQLMVNTGQTAAVKLYEKCGFTIANTEKDQLMGDGKTYDEYIMEKVLARKTS